MSKRKKKKASAKTVILTMVFAVIILILGMVIYVMVCKSRVDENPMLGLEKEVELNIDIVDTQNERFILPVDAVMQNPELPTGCEITALTTVLNYYNYNVDKCYMADNYLEKNYFGTVTPWEAFIGNPYSESGYGCFAPVIVDSAQRFFDDTGNFHCVKNVTGASKEELFSLVKSGIPVIVWATIDLMEPEITKLWGEISFDWYAHEHCMVLIGYDTIRDTVIMADPLEGLIEYDRDIFMERYNYMYSMAIAIEMN